MSLRPAGHGLGKDVPLSTPLTHSDKNETSISSDPRVQTAPSTGTTTTAKMKRFWPSVPVPVDFKYLKRDMKLSPKAGSLAVTNARDSKPSTLHGISSFTVAILTKLRELFEPASFITALLESLHTSFEQKAAISTRQASSSGQAKPWPYSAIIIMADAYLADLATERKMSRHPISTVSDFFNGLSHHLHLDSINPRIRFDRLRKRSGSAVIWSAETAQASVAGVTAANGFNPRGRAMSDVQRRCPQNHPNAVSQTKKKQTMEEEREKQVMRALHSASTTAVEEQLSETLSDQSTGSVMITVPDPSSGASTTEGTIFLAQDGRSNDEAQWIVAPVDIQETRTSSMYSEDNQQGTGKVGNVAGSDQKPGKALALFPNSRPTTTTERLAFLHQTSAPKVKLWDPPIWRPPMEPTEPLPPETTSTAITTTTSRRTITTTTTAAITTTSTRVEDIVTTTNANDIDTITSTDTLLTSTRLNDSVIGTTSADDNTGISIISLTASTTTAADMRTRSVVEGSTTEDTALCSNGTPCISTGFTSCLTSDSVNVSVTTAIDDDSEAVTTKRTLSTSTENRGPGTTSITTVGLATPEDRGSTALILAITITMAVIVGGSGVAMIIVCYRIRAVGISDEFAVLRSSSSLARNVSVDGSLLSVENFVDRGDRRQVNRALDEMLNKPNGHASAVINRYGDFVLESQRNQFFGDG